jgi:hypothetical protein
MNRRAIPLKSRVRYEGRAQTFDRRAKIGADLEKLPNPIWRTVGMVLRANLNEAAQKQSADKSVGR